MALLHGSRRSRRAELRARLHDRYDAPSPGIAIGAGLREFAPPATVRTCRPCATRKGWPRGMRCGRGAPPRSRCRQPSAPTEQEGLRPTRRMSEALRCCRREPPELQGSSEDRLWLSLVLWIADGSALRYKGLPGEPGQGTSVREGLSRDALSQGPLQERCFTPSPE